MDTFSDKFTNLIRPRYSEYAQNEIQHIINELTTGKDPIISVTSL